MECIYKGTHFKESYRPTGYSLEVQELADLWETCKRTLQTYKKTPTHYKTYKRTPTNYKR